MNNFLKFEQPIADLEAKIEELRRVGTDTELNIIEEISRLESKSKELKRLIFSSLTPAQTVEMARHPLRPHTLDYIARIFTEFDELHGDRYFDAARRIVGGLAYLDEQPVMVIGHQKGRSTKEKVERNFGMPKPEDYRKALRLMQTAERFKLPIITFIDTPGAYPGIDAEAHNQSGAIAHNLFTMSTLKTPIVCVVIGEGGSGGALAIGVGDRVLMLQYAVYSVISPEGCASILWKSTDKAAEAADAMWVTAERIMKLNLIDRIIKEPLGGAHRDVNHIATSVKEALIENLAALQRKSIDTLLHQRYERLMSFGRKC